jgi:hypothetical protein
VEAGVGTSVEDAGTDGIRTVPVVTPTSAVRRPLLSLAGPAIVLAATDGVTRSGWYIAPRNGAAVVLAHGAGSTRSSVLDHAAVLATRG